MVSLYLSTICPGHTTQFSFVSTKAIDKDLEKSKSKLAGILKKRKGKDGPERK